ncbi:MAG: cupredoxin domain-containing protein [Microthrixaceae bacterium]
MTRPVISRRRLLRSAASTWAIAFAGVGLGALGTTSCSNDSDQSDSDQGGSGGSTGSTAVPETDLPTIPDEDFEQHTDQAVVEISVVDNSFEPRWVVVSAGTEVRWTNNGRNDHNIIAEPEGAFAGVDHGQFSAGSTHAVTFEKPGEFPYFCSLHGTPRNGQNGVIRVVA